MAKSFYGIAKELREVDKLGTQIAIMVGGGKYLSRRARQKGFLRSTRATGDYMGMLATVLNALALQDALEKARRAHPACRAPLRCIRSASPSFAVAPVRHLEKKAAVGDFRRRHRQPLLLDGHLPPPCAPMEIKADVILKSHPCGRRLRC